MEITKELWFHYGCFMKTVTGYEKTTYVLCRVWLRLVFKVYEIARIDSYLDLVKIIEDLKKRKKKINVRPKHLIYAIKTFTSFCEVLGLLSGKNPIKISRHYKLKQLSQEKQNLFREFVAWMINNGYRNFPDNIISFLHDYSGSVEDIQIEQVRKYMQIKIINGGGLATFIKFLALEKKVRGQEADKFIQKENAKRLLKLNPINPHLLQFVEKFINEYISIKYQKSINCYKSNLNFFIRFLTYKQINSFTDVTSKLIFEIVVFMNQMFLSSSQIIHLLSNVKKFYSWYSMETDNPIQPVTEFHYPKLKKYYPRPLKPCDLQKTMDNLPDNFLGTAIVFVVGGKDRNKWGLGTGCRKREVLGLKRSELDLEHKQAIVMGKGDKERTVNFSDEVRDVLKKWIDDNPAPQGCDLVFHINGYPITYYLFTKEIKKLRQVVGFHFTFHQFRHSFATYARRERKMPLEIVKDELGHASANTTLLYSEVDKTEVREAYLEAEQRSAEQKEQKVPQEHIYGTPSEILEKGLLKEFKNS